jgi:hypothetical protein
MFNKAIQIKYLKYLIVDRNIMLCLYLFFSSISFIWCQNTNKINPPSWIIGKWNSEKGEFIFEKDNWFLNGDDFLSAFEDFQFNVEFIENKTDEYYEIIILFENIEYIYNRYYRPEGEKMLVEIKWKGVWSDELEKIELIKTEE